MVNLSVSNTYDPQGCQMMGESLSQEPHEKICEEPKSNEIVGNKRGKRHSENSKASKNTFTCPVAGCQKSYGYI